MNPNAVVSALSRSLVLLLVCAAVGMALLAGLSVQTMHGIEAGNQTHAATFVPAKRLTAGFEREVLNARIFFIYYVTIQKPGSLESGWQRFHQGEAVLRGMAAMVNGHEELANLRGPVAQLQKDVAAYSVALDATLTMVASGETKGPHYDAQVKEWASRGATMVKDSAMVENLTFKSSENNTKDIATQLHVAQTRAKVYFGFGFTVYLALTMLILRRLKRLIASGTGEASHMRRAVPITLAAR